MMNSAKHYLGLGKTLFNSSAALVYDNNLSNYEIVLSERITRKKASGAWPEQAINQLPLNQTNESLNISENRDVISPFDFENQLNKNIPFLTYLEKKGLRDYSSHFNKNINYITHHLCHAYAALAMSPFHESIIIVIDGAGSKFDDFKNGICDNHDFKGVFNDFHEECTVYLQQGAKLKVIEKFWQKFKTSKIPGHELTEGVGLLYEKAAEYIFNNKRAAGKVMGLAPYGNPKKIISPTDYLTGLDWNHAFTGTSKPEWESNPNRESFQNIAASVQHKYETHLHELIKNLKIKFPKIDNLVITGGTALNCTNNYKLLNYKIFDNIYIPPFPSDECIGFGAANYFFINENPTLWTPKPITEQHSFFGSTKSLSTKSQTLDIFKEYKCVVPENIINFSADLLAKNKVIGWFQGRSETGPRALGNRSILANPEIPNLKNYLNEKVKFRESFRPYGCSVLFDYAQEYFEVTDNFHNPFMSFATKIRSTYIDRLKEVSHIDKSSRMQTVTYDANSKFFKLIEHFGKSTGLYCLLNTSLNIMGEPIVETVEDAKNFLDSTNVYGIVVNDIFIYKKG